jgi:hypothetical protein
VVGENKVKKRKEVAKIILVCLASGKRKATKKKLEKKKHN